MHFDWSINVGTVCAVLMLTGTTVKYARQVIKYLKGMNYRVNVMWSQFEVEHPDLVLRANRAEAEAEWTP